jgi:hypothetical protein
VPQYHSQSCVPFRIAESPKAIVHLWGETRLRINQQLPYIAGTIHTAGSERWHLNEKSRCLNRGLVREPGGEVQAESRMREIRTSGL